MFTTLLLFGAILLGFAALQAFNRWSARKVIGLDQKPADTGAGAPVACGSCDPVAPETASLSVQEKKSKGRKDAVQLRLTRLFARVDYRACDDPYGQLTLTEAREHAAKIIQAVNELLTIGEHLKVWGPDWTGWAVLTEKNDGTEIAHLLYVGLRDQLVEYLCERLDECGIDEDFYRQSQRASRDDRYTGNRYCDDFGAYYDYEDDDFEDD